MQQTEKQTTNKKQRKDKKSRRRWLERLVDNWPKTFDLKNPRPLAVGITDTISAELNAIGAGGHGAVRYAIKSYISNIRYIRALAAGGPRYKLHGEPDGEVTPEQRERALQALKALKEKKTMFLDEVTQ